MHPSKTFMTRNQDEALGVKAQWEARIGEVVAKYGRITDKLVGVEIEEVEFVGRPLFQVIPKLHNSDPLFDV